MPLRFAQLHRTAQPTVEPVTVAEIKAQLRLLHSDDDDDLAFMLGAGREWAEDFTNLSLIYQTWVALYSGWPVVGDNVLVLPRGPLSIVELVQYLDEDGEWVEVSEDDYTVDEIGGTIRFVDSFGSPRVSLNHTNPVEVTFRAGFGDTGADVPMRIRQAIRLWVASQYLTERGNRRVNVSFRAPTAAENLLATFRNRPL